MSKDELHQLAQQDTPSNVEVPNSITGLLVWGFTRFGTNLMLMMIACGALTYGLQGIYSDLRKDNASVMEIVRTQVATNERLSSSLNELAKQVENNTRAIAEERRGRQP